MWRLSEFGYKRGMTKLLRRWPDWVAYPAAIWSAAYGALAVFWSSGGTGFPFGLDNDPTGGVSILSWVEADKAAPVMAAVALVGALVALAMSRGRGSPTVRLALLTFAWATAGIVALVIPDYRVLVVVAYAPIILIGTPLGLVEDANLADAITWPLVNQVLFIIGGLLWALTAVGYHRRTRNACVVCGRGSQGEGWTASERAATWGRWAAYVAVVVPLLYAATRLAWAFGIPIGISEEFFREGQEVGLWQLGGALGAMAVIGAVLTFGLIRPWGEMFPQWLPWIGGRRVPAALAIVPAALVSLLVTSAGLMFVRIVLFGRFALGDIDLGLDENWAAIAPELLWPIWGVALGAATAGYYHRRRGVCQHCGRGGHVAGRPGVPDSRRETGRVPRPGP